MAKILKSSIPYKQPSTENLIEFIKEGLREHSSRTIIIDSTTGIGWTGQEIEATISTIAKFLKDTCDLKKGDVCSLYADENDKVALIILSVIAAGGACNYLTAKSSGRELHDTANVLGSKYIISTSNLLVNIRADISDLDVHIISIDDIVVGFKSCCTTLDEFFHKENTDLKATLDSLISSVNIDNDRDFAVIQFSSGTTGKPKPIPRTHKNLCHLVMSVDHEELMSLRPDVVITGSLPITHRPGIWALLASIHSGSTFVIWNKLSDVKDALATIAKYKVTIFSSSLPFLSMLGNVGTKLKGEYDTSSWEHIITSGAKILNMELPRSLIRDFNLKSLRQCFGMTESGWVFLIEMSLSRDNFLSVGHVVPSMEAIVLDKESQQQLGPNDHGEIALRSPQIFPGYITDKKGIFNRSDFTQDGWFKTGDKGYFDEQDLVFIEGRYKEIMMFENNSLFFPNEIEALITEHQAVEAACVVKVPHVNKDYPYDKARAFITLNQGLDVDEVELVEFVRKMSPNIVLAGGVRKLDKFPRLQNGKVDKQTLSRLE